MPEMWRSRIQYLLAFSCLYSVVSCLTSTQCDPYADTAGKVGLNCSHRSLDSVPPSLPTDTEVLLLSFNSIKSVSLSSFKNLSKLHDLDLSNNQIKHLEGDYPLSVEKLDLSSNSLTTIPDFRKLPHLRKLILDDNEISALPDRAFQPLVNLSEFSIKGNLIIHIPDHILDPLENLRHLTLSANKIKAFPKDALSRLEHLETFNVSNNELRTIPQDFFENNVLLYVFLYNNPWHCECNAVKYLKDWIDDNDGNIYKVVGEPDSETVVCATPTARQGTPIINLPAEQICPSGTTDATAQMSIGTEIPTTFSTLFLQTSPFPEICAQYTDSAGKVGLNCSHRSLDSVPPSLPTDTEVLLLSFNSIKTVSLSSFKNLFKLHDLDLSNNQIKHLEGDYPLSVEKLDLSSNSLTTIPDFRKLPHLRKLILDDNEISALPDRAFQPLVNLSEFSIKGNLIIHIPDHILDPLENLRHLTLSANKIKAFPKDALSRLEHLETFNVSNNELRTIPQDFFENNVLLYVFLYNNPWHCECNAVKYLKDWIDDNDGNIYKVVGEPDSETVVCATPTARQGTPIVNLPAEQICPSGTTDATAQMSIGTEIPTTFSTLFLQTSPFPEICAQYTDSAGKVGLNCSHRSLDSVPPSLRTDTEVLLLSFNSIKTVSLSSFKNLFKLHDLDLSNNQIKHLEGDYPLSVEKLDLSSNSLTTIPDFRKLPHLRKLILDDNEISALPDRAFQPLVNLSEFSIKGNLIVHIPDHIFDPLENLRHLTLSANKIKAFPKDALSRLEHLETFNVSNNELRTIPQDFFENNVLLYVFLYNNPWHCECNAVKYLKDWIDDNDGNIYKVVGEPDSETVVCATPTAWRGTPIINLPAEQICPSGTTDTMAQMSIGTEIPTTFSTLFLQTSPFPEICAQYTDSAGKVEMNCSHRSLDSVPPSLPTDTEVLMLSFNSIKSVSLSSFKNLFKLHDLDLSNNQIKHFEGDYPLSVEKLDLSSNSLTTIPNFRKLPHLRKLILDDNEISALPDGAFQPLVNLEDFSIKGNIIVHIPDHIFDPLNSLRHLTLSANKMKAFPKDALSRLEHLETFDVSNNELRTIPQDFFKQQKLLYVFLYNNPWHCECNAVKYLKDWIDDNDGNIYKVVGEPDSETVVCETPTAWQGTPIINLSAEQICPSGTTDTMAQMSIGSEFPASLSTLFLQTSPLPDICAQYTDSAGKVEMNCSHRSLDSVPPSLPTDTEVLMLSFNSIKSVSLSSFKNLSKLHDLDLSNNQIKHLEGDYPLSVEKLDLSSNSLTTIPDFRELPHLRKLILDDNEISALPDGAFEPLVNLSEFSIKGNLIVHIPDHIFDPLENLRHLTLSANKIKAFPKDALSRLEHLETFHVSNNELRTIPQDFFENNTLLYVFLYNNWWHCDCNIQYLSTWIRSNEGKVYSPEGSLDDTVVICSMPPELDGIPLIHVPIGYGCVGTTSVTLSTQAASTATNRDDASTVGARRSWALEALQHLERNCWLLFTLLCLSICLVLLEISALSIYAIRFYRTFYLPLKQLSQRRWYIRLVRYSLVLPHLQQIYPPPRPGSSLEGEAQTAIATDTAGDAFTSFL